MKLLLPISMAFCVNLHAQDAIIAKPIQITDCNSIPDDLPFELKPFGYESGVKIHYLVVADGLIGINEKSLSIDYIKNAKGNDISKKRNGSNDFELGSFPKASEDGKYLTFSIEIKSNHFGSAESMGISGSLIGYTGTDMKDAECELDMDQGVPVTIGPFTVVNAKKSPKDSSGLIGEAFGDLMIGNKESTNIEVAGPFNKFISIKALVGDKELDKNGNSINDSKRTYKFDKTAEGKLKVKISYWDKVEELKIKLDGGFKK